MLPAPVDTAASGSRSAARVAGAWAPARIGSTGFGRGIPELEVEYRLGIDEIITFVDAGPPAPTWPPDGW